MIQRDKLTDILKYCFLILFFLAYLIYLFRLFALREPGLDHGFWLGSLLMLMSALSALILLVFIRIGCSRISPVFIDYIYDRFLFIELIFCTSVLGLLLIFATVYLQSELPFYAYLGLLFEALSLPALFVFLYIFMMLYPLIVPGKLIAHIAQHIMTNIQIAFEKNDYSAERKAAIVRHFRYLGMIITDCIRKRQIFQEAIQALQTILEHYHSRKDTAAKGWFYIEANHFPDKTPEDIALIIEHKTWFEMLILDTFEQVLDSTDTSVDFHQRIPFWSVPEYIMSRALERKDRALLLSLLLFYQTNLLKLMEHENKSLYLSLFHSFQHVLPDIQRTAPALLENITDNQNQLLHYSLKNKPDLVPSLSEHLRLFHESCVTLDVLNRESLLTDFLDSLKTIVEQSKYSSNRKSILPLITDLLLLGKFYRSVNEEHLIALLKEKLNASPFVELIRAIQFLRKTQLSSTRKQPEPEKDELTDTELEISRKLEGTEDPLDALDK
ncbi:hypothetical protein JXQ70_15945 [bacterium]|nr:hypothetical protein [bacterium]